MITTRDVMIMSGTWLGTAGGIVALKFTIPDISIDTLVITIGIAAALAAVYSFSLGTDVTEPPCERKKECE
jgi:hypothetical protein